jgi:prephenate dehydrogenase
MADDNFSRMVIVGLGLIGGSLGLALRTAQPGAVITGWDQQAATLDMALQRGAIDHAASSLERSVRNADLVVVATPVLAAKEVFTAIAPHLQSGAIVTDVASTKAQVVQWAWDLLPATVTFVGGHPMAGSEQHGIEHARADLFHGAVYCLTPLEPTPPDVLATLEELVTGIGARPLRIDAHAHDAYVAAVSHLPFVLAAALVQHTSSDKRWSAMRQLAATGYRDATRLASGDVRMHRDICLSNADALKPQLLSMSRLLEEIAAHLDDPQYLEQLFEQAKEARDEWLSSLMKSVV